LPQHEKKSVAKWAARKVEMLLLQVPDRLRYQLLFRLEQALEEWATDFGIKGPLPEIEGDKDWNGFRRQLGETDLRDYLQNSRIAFVVDVDDKTGQVIQFSEVPGAIVDSPERAQRGHTAVDPGAEQQKDKPPRPRRRKAAA
jgi:hypothetical protein